MIKNQFSKLPLGVGVKHLYLFAMQKAVGMICSLSDFERPLNERGKNDAPKMAKRLVDRKI